MKRLAQITILTALAFAIVPAAKSEAQLLRGIFSRLDSMRTEFVTRCVGPSCTVQQTTASSEPVTIEAIHAAHTAIRAAHKLPEQILDADLTAGAQSWADEISKFLSFRHDASFLTGGTAENIAWTTAAIDAEGIAATWYNSTTGHRGNLLSNKPRVGYGFVRRGGRSYSVARYSE